MKLKSTKVEILITINELKNNISFEKYGEIFQIIIILNYRY